MVHWQRWIEPGGVSDWKQIRGNKPKKKSAGNVLRICEFQIGNTNQSLPGHFFVNNEQQHIQQAQKKSCVLIETNTLPLKTGLEVVCI